MNQLTYRVLLLLMTLGMTNSLAHAEAAQPICRNDIVMGRGFCRYKMPQPAQVRPTDKGNDCEYKCFPNLTIPFMDSFYDCRPSDYKPMPFTCPPSIPAGPQIYIFAKCGDTDAAYEECKDKVAGTGDWLFGMTATERQIACFKQKCPKERFPFPIDPYPIVD